MVVLLDVSWWVVAIFKCQGGWLHLNRDNDYVNTEVEKSSQENNFTVTFI